MIFLPYMKYEQKKTLNLGQRALHLGFKYMRVLNASQKKLAPPAVDLQLKEIMLGKLSSVNSILWPISPERQTQRMYERKTQLDLI